MAAFLAARDPNVSPHFVPTVRWLSPIASDDDHWETIWQACLQNPAKLIRLPSYDIAVHGLWFVIHLFNYINCVTNIGCSSSLILIKKTIILLLLLWFSIMMKCNNFSSFNEMLEKKSKFQAHLTASRRLTCTPIHYLKESLLDFIHFVNNHSFCTSFPFGYEILHKVKYIIFNLFLRDM